MKPERGLARGLCPTFTARSVTEVTPAGLRRLGIRAVILDLDNTLVAWHGEELDAEVAEWIQALTFDGFSLCIASNTHRPARLRRVAEALGVQYVTGVAKPRKGGFVRAMAMMGTSPAETAVIGDQVLTDIWGGNRCRLVTVLVNPLSPREFIGTRWISRRVERWLMQHFGAQGWLKPFEVAPEPDGPGTSQV